MNLLDVIIIVAVGSAILGGYRLGFVARATSWLGLVLGLVLAANFVPSAVNLLPDNSAPGGRLLLALGVILGLALLGQALGMFAGATFRKVLPPGPARQTDRFAGGVAGFLGVLVAVWLILPSVAEARGLPAQQAHNSSIARALDRLLPPPPDSLQLLRRLMGPEGFPQVFDALRPAPDAGPPPGDSGLSQAVISRVSASTVKVEGISCRRIQDGSGFSVGADTIVTNAHVVAGERQTWVIRPDGRKLKANVASFDSNRDLAVLRVAGLGEPALAVGSARTGSTGAVFGHPEGQAALAVMPAAIRQQVQAVGRDLYDAHQTRRGVFILASDLRPGDSGGALVNPAGQVVGVAFAIAPDRPGTAYALTSEELRAALSATGAATGPVDTGPCLLS